LDETGWSVEELHEIAIEIRKERFVSLTPSPRTDRWDIDASILRSLLFVVITRKGLNEIKS
jgi:hypothetical protein